MTNKYTKDGMVAVLYSPGYGAGWSTWGDHDYGEDMIFDPWIVDILLNEEFTDEEATKRVLAHCAVKYPALYIGGAQDLRVAWVPPGTAFRITEYDGNERIEYRDQIDWTIA